MALLAFTDHALGQSTTQSVNYQNAQAVPGGNGCTTCNQTNNVYQCSNSTLSPPLVYGGCQTPVFGVSCWLSPVYCGGLAATQDCTPQHNAVTVQGNICGNTYYASWSP